MDVSSIHSLLSEMLSCTSHTGRVKNSVNIGGLLLTLVKDIYYLILEKNVYSICIVCISRGDPNPSDTNYSLLMQAQSI